MHVPRVRYLVIGVSILLLIGGMLIVSRWFGYPRSLWFPRSHLVLEDPISPPAGKQIPPGVRWQWQLDGAFDRTAADDAQVFDVDLFDTDGASIADLHRRGYTIICSVSVGTVEEWRPDAHEFPRSIIGQSYPEWPGERWVDIRRIDVLGPILDRRFVLARARGCDAIEPDNLDAYTNDPGFPITAADQVRFSVWVANAVHRAGMSVGLKNDPAHAAVLEPYFDWALVEECAAEGWCSAMQPFILNRKAVLQAEYTDTDVDFSDACRVWGAAGYSLILKHRSLDEWRRSCATGA